MKFIYLNADEERDKKDGYSTVDIIEKSSKLSGDWLEKEIRKSFPIPAKEQQPKKNDKESSIAQ